MLSSATTQNKTKAPVDNALIASSVLEALMHQSTDSIAVKDLSGRYLMINAAGANFLGRDTSEIIGKTDFDLFELETAKAIRDSDCKIMETAKTELIEDFLRPLNGKNRYFQAMKCAFTTPSGEIIGIINVVRDITEAKLAEMELKQTNKDLDHFASVAAHDLQAPIRKVIFFSEVLEQELANLSDDARDYLGRIQKTAKKMSTLLSDILDLSRIRKSPPNYSVIHLKSIIEEAILDSTPEQLSAADIFTLTGTDIALQADASQIRQLLINLFTNALKFQKKNQTPLIQISAKITLPGKCLIEVKDNGFDPKLLPRMFKPFERLNSAKDYTGTGMGLTICERIAQRHQGQITAKSVIGQGSTFYIELPLRQTPAKIIP